MGISASVLCTCYPEGKTTPCPAAEHFHYDPSAAPALDLGYEDSEALHEAFQRWLTTCCEHPGMVYALEFIASWRGYRAFSDALDELGSEKFPLLTAQLPDGVDGISSAADAAGMLDEIARFEALQTVVTQAVLVDSERGQDISMGSQVLGGALTMDRVTGYDLGFDERGFFVRDRWEMNRELFRALRVEQQLLHPEELLVEYVDRDSERRFQCRVPFGKVMPGEDGLPRMALQFFHVELRPTTPMRFLYILEPLKRILQASVATGNPVRWA